MFELVTPHPRFHHSYLAAVDEFIAADEAHHANLLHWPAENGFEGRLYHRNGLASLGVFTEFLAAQRIQGIPRPAAYVPFTELWMADGDEYLGRLSLRHTLNELLLTWGGHIGYSVRPSARRRGHATRALGQILPVCAELGIDPALVTCDVDHEASRRIIERNGGVYEDTRVGKLRYWIRTT